LKEKGKNMLRGDSKSKNYLKPTLLDERMRKFREVGVSLARKLEKHSLAKRNY